MSHEGAGLGARLTALSLLCVIASCLLIGCGESKGGSASRTRTRAGVASTRPAATTTTPTTHTTTTPAQPSSESAELKARETMIKTYGKAGSNAEREAIAEVVKAYYLALSTRNFPRACSLLSAQIKRLVLSSMEQNPVLHGKGCVRIFTLTVGRNGHGSLSPEVTVHSVRLYRNEKGFALISTKDRRSGQIRVEREHGVWKVGSLIGGPLR